MELKQIAFSPDGLFLYAIDGKGKLWAAPVRNSGAGKPDREPEWTPIKRPPE